MLLLAELDTTAGIIRFILSDEGRFTDISGNAWYGSKIISMSDLEFTSNGDAPATNISLAYIVDPDGVDLINEVRQYGVAAIRNRECRFYLQYIASMDERLAPVSAPLRIATRRMMNLTYSFEGQQNRLISVNMEGPFNLRAKPPFGRITDAEYRRRSGGDPSLEFMPFEGSDEESLFGL